MDFEKIDMTKVDIIEAEKMIDMGLFTEREEREIMHRIMKMFPYGIEFTQGEEGVVMTINLVEIQRNLNAESNKKKKNMLREIRDFIEVDGVNVGQIMPEGIEWTQYQRFGEIFAIGKVNGAATIVGVFIEKDEGYFREGDFCLINAWMLENRYIDLLLELIKIG